MKKKLLFLFLLSAFQIQAQVINNVYSVPANPTTADSVYILADCQFGNASCNAHTQGQSFLSSNHIGAYALHCLGMLTVICNYTDTFSLGLLPAGNYTFDFQLDEGFGGPPCTPGIAPGPSQTYNFTVSVPTSVNEIGNEDFKIYPNPASRELRIKNAGLRIEKISIYNSLGGKLFSQQLAANNQEQIVDVSTLSPGIYIVELKAGDKLSRKIFSVQR